jgi:hypothetical protein
MNWITYRFRLTGTTELLGGMPKTENLIRAQMSSKEVRITAKMHGRDPEKIIAENMQAMGIEPGQTAEEEEKSMSCGFRRNPAGVLCLGGHQITSLLIDCATTLGLSRKVRGLKDLLTRGLIVLDAPGNLLPIANGTGEPATEETGTREWGSTITDRMGTRSILRRYDYLLPWAVQAGAKFPDTSILTKEVWGDLWEMAEAQGLGSARPRGYGRFTVESMDRD